MSNICQTPSKAIIWETVKGRSNKYFKWLLGQFTVALHIFSRRNAKKAGDLI